MIDPAWNGRMSSMVYPYTGYVNGRKYMSNALALTGNKESRHWLHIALGSLAYIVAQIMDYFFTAYGIANNLSQEANPIVQGYMDVFGVGKGLAVCKSLMCAIIIYGVIIAHLACRQKGRKLRVEFVLYAGAFMTLLGGSLWLTKL